MTFILFLVLLLGAGSPRAPAAEPAPHGIRYLYLIRHGAYDRDSMADDRVGNGLNPLGVRQAKRVAERLAHLPVKKAMLVSSDYARARETAAEIGRALAIPVAEDSLIHECTPSDRDARPDSPEEGACDSHLRAAWAKYVRPAADGDEHDVLVCHGNVIRWFVSRSLGQGTKQWRAMEIANASLSVIAVRPDGTTRLVLFSDVGHLPVPDQTWTGRGAGWSPASAPSRRGAP